MYAKEIREALTAAIDTQKLAEAWQALHPKNVGSGIAAGAQGRPRAAGKSVSNADRPSSATKAVSPLIGTFLDRALQALIRALTPVLRRLWAEGWVLGQRSAEALTAGQDAADWGPWTPGDAAAAEAIAGPGLRQLLDQADIRIRSIAQTRLEELAAVLEDTLRSDETRRPPLPEPLPPMLSVGDLARQIEDVLDNPSRAELVAQAEIGRAQAEAARQVYAETGVAEVEISTAEDAKVCPVCDAAQEVGAHPVGTPPMVLLHPRCRCAEIPVLEGALKAALVSQRSVNYRPAEPGAGRRCGTCSMFRPPASCTLVEPPVGDDGVCDRWSHVMTPLTAAGVP